jgi:hypothetical protein
VIPLPKLPFDLKVRWGGMRLKVRRFEATGERPRWTDRDIEIFKMMDAHIYAAEKELAEYETDAVA